MVGGDLHHVPDELRRRHDRDARVGLVDLLVLVGARQLARRLDGLLRAVGQDDLVGDGRRRLDHVEVVLALEALLHDLHVEQAEEAAAEAEAERLAGHGLEVERGVRERERRQAFAQALEVAGVRREEVRVHHVDRRAVAGEHLHLRPLVDRHRVADAHVAEVLDVRDEVADLAGPELAAARHLGREAADLDRLVGLLGAHHVDELALADRAVDHAQVHDDAAVLVVLGVEDQRAQRVVGLALGRRDLLDDLVEQLGHAEARLRAHAERDRGVDADRVLDLFLDHIGPRVGQVDLVDDRQDLEVALDGEVGVGDGLGLDALAGVDEQQRALAGLQGLLDLVVEVDVARRVDQVELVALALVLVVDRDRAGLDRDAALALEVHRVEQLGLHVALVDGAGDLEQAVGEGRLAVVDVRDDREVADEAVVHGALFPGRFSGARSIRADARSRD